MPIAQNLIMFSLQRQGLRCSLSLLHSLPRETGRAIDTICRNSRDILKESGDTERLLLVSFIPQRDCKYVKHTAKFSRTIDHI